MMLRQVDQTKANRKRMTKSLSFGHTIFENEEIKRIATEVNNNIGRFNNTKSDATKNRRSSVPLLKNINSSYGGYSSNEGDNIKVYVRIRPPHQQILEGNVDTSTCLEVTSPTSLTISTKPEPKQFSYDHVAHMQTTQEEVFATVGKGIIEAFVNGFNGTIFAYGQTGSGKTFTMLGPSDDTDNFSHELRGVIPRGFEYLFSLINRQQEKTGDRVEFLARCSFLEIYNEQVFDLLEPSSASLHLRENLQKGVFVADLAERDVSSAKDAYDVLQSGWTNRRVASTSMNRESSRSHAVFTVTLESKKRSGGMNNIKISKLHLVDLAGSERQKDTQTQDLRLKEAGSINKSLSALGNVIMALVDIAHGKTRHVHYRDSKLTFILRDSLGGNAKTYIIANVHPSSRCFGETLSTLNFARRAKMIKNKAVVNEDITGSVSELQSEIRRLKELLAEAKNGIQPEIKSAGFASNVHGESVSQDGSHWREMMLNSIAEREQSENEKNALQEKVVKLEELCSKKEKFYQSTKMILKFRNDHIVKLERMLKKELGPQEENEKDKEIKVLKEEIKLLQSSIEHHPEVKRFAMENLELRAEIKRLKALDPSNGDFTKTMAEKHRYTLQLERQLHDLMSSQSNDLEKSLSSSQQSLEASNAEIEKIKMEFAQVQAKVDTAQNELKKSRQECQEQSEKLISFTETSRKKELELQSDLAALRKSNNELERTLEILQIRTAVERTAMNSLHMQTIKTLSTPRRFATPQKKINGSLAKQSTPVKKLNLNNSKDDEKISLKGLENHDHADKDKINNSKNSTNGSFNDEKYINDPERLLEDEPPPRILQRKDSLNDVSDEEDDVNPFWDFANETKDDEIVYIEALQDEIKHQQKLLSDALQRHYEEQKSKLPLIENIAKLDHKVNDLEKLLNEERSVWSSKEMELVSQLTSLRDSYKETQGNATILKSELDDVRRLLQVTEKQLDSLRKEKKGEVLELERINHSMQQEVVNLKIHNMNLQAEVDKTAEDNNNLQANYEECKEELHFTKDNNSVLEKDLIAERQKVKDLEQELQSVIEKLNNELDNKVKLSQEDKEQELLKSVETINVLREELSKQSKKCEEQEQTISKLQRDLERVRAEFTTQKWCSLKDKDAISKFMVRIEDFKKTIAEKDSTISSLTSELDEIREQHESSIELCNEKKKKIQKLTESLKVESDKFAKERMDREKEVSNLQEEVQTSQEHCKELQITIEKLRQQLESLQVEHIEAKKTIAGQKNLILMAEELNSEESKSDLDETNKSDIVFVEHEEPEEAKKQLLNVSRLAETYKAKEIDYVKEIHGLKRRFSEFEIIESRKKELEDREKILEEEIDLLEGENVHLKERLSFAEKEKETHREEIEKYKIKLDDTLKSEKRAQLEKFETAQKYAASEMNLCNAQDDLEANKEELEKTKELEQKYFEESNFYRSRVEVVEEEKKRYEQQILWLNKEKDVLELENSRLNGHRNHNQKIEYVTNLKKENNSLREKLQKLTFELNKMSDCEKCRRHDS